jgi:hypothetical protein
MIYINKAINCCGTGRQNQKGMLTDFLRKLKIETG